jgi:hypothetical protein
MVSHKMACLSSPSLRSDLPANHGVSISRDYAKDLAEAVAWWGAGEGMGLKILRLRFGSLRRGLRHRQPGRDVHVP